MRSDLRQKYLNKKLGDMENNSEKCLYILANRHFIKCIWPNLWQQASFLQHRISRDDQRINHNDNLMKEKRLLFLKLFMVNSLVLYISRNELWPNVLGSEY